MVLNSVMTVVAYSDGIGVFGKYVLYSNIIASLKIGEGSYRVKQTIGPGEKENGHIKVIFISKRFPI